MEQNYVIIIEQAYQLAAAFKYFVIFVFRSKAHHESLNSDLSSHGEIHSNSIPCNFNKIGYNLYIYSIIIHK